MTHTLELRAKQHPSIGAYLILVVACAVPPAGKTEVAGVQNHAAVAPVTHTASRSEADILSRPELGAYHGWIKYLMFQAAHAAERYPRDEQAQSAAQQRLTLWTDRILSNPNWLNEVRGTFEWAYESLADGSGQPFKLSVPLDYDANRPAPVSVYLHGYTGDHLSHSTNIVDHTGPFAIAALGRSRGGAYRALAEADVLQLLDYVAAHWAVDLDRVHLTGGSMGGHGALLLGARHPGRFASVQTACGWASDLPLENLVHMPVYATHSDDDFIVPVLHSRAPLSELFELGGQVIYDETSGYGHEVWNYEAGNERGRAWCTGKVLVDSRQIRDIEFTALDEGAASAWWAEVAEWGPRPEPAQFELHARDNNVLEARLENVTALRLRLSKSPFNARERLRVVGVGDDEIEVAPPLPEVIVIEHRPPRWSLAESTPASHFRLHSPGGANRLYAGEPLLIVYGTTGDPATNSALQRAADAASKSGSAAWTSSEGAAGADGVPHHHSLYGRLHVKADVDVSESDVRDHHLVLLGSASQNRVVAAIAERLPVRLDRRVIRYSDGVELSSENKVLGLVHYNPAAPSRLLFWVASEVPGAYTSMSAVARAMDAPTGLDAIVLRDSDSSLVMGRSFDSRWNWLDRSASQLLPSSIETTRQLNRWVAAAVRRATHADFAVATDLGFELEGPRWPSAEVAQTPGTTRLADIFGFYYYDPIAVMSLTGTELLDAERLLSNAPGVDLEPSVERARVDPARSYTVALTTDQLWTVGRRTRLRTSSYRQTEITASTALSQVEAIASRPSNAGASGRTSDQTHDSFQKRP